MSELDPRLAALLQRTPAPTVLDAAHRTAVAAAARQAWFRAQAARRRTLLATALAACLVAGLSGFLLRGAFAAPTVPVAEPLATADRPTAPPTVFTTGPDAASGAWRQDDAQTAPEEAVSVLTTASPAPILADRTTPPEVRKEATDKSTEEAFSHTEDRRRRALAGERTDGEMKAGADAFAKSAAPARSEARRAAPPAAPAAPAPAAESVLQSGASAASRDAIRIAADAPERGRLLAAAAVLDAVHRGRLAEADQAPALRAALAALDGLAHPEAERLRAALRAALRR